MNFQCNVNAVIKRLIVAVYRLLPAWSSTLVVRLLKPTYLIGVVAVVFDDENRLLILEHTYHMPAWRLPGGLMERQESPIQTAVREVREEANCHVRPIGVVSAANVKKSFDVAVLAILEAQEPFVPNAEIRNYRWVDISVADELHPVQKEFVQAALAFLNRI